MLSALGDGFRSVARNWGLVVLVLAANLALALLLAAPLAAQLERDLAHRGASSTMMYGFDYDWWSHWWEEQDGFARSLAPDILGAGLFLKNRQLVHLGHLPARLFPEAGNDEPARVRTRQTGPSAPGSIDPLILGVGLVYLLVQTFLAGGILGVFRAAQGGWTFRGLIHGSGFYFGRLLRVSLLALLLAGLVFTLNVPFARWVDGLAREAVSERTALGLLLGCHALLFVALLLVHMVASFARVIVVNEERHSAALAMLTSLSFCGRHLAAAAGQYLVVLAAGALLVGAWIAFDTRHVVIGWRSQLVAFALFQAFLLGRIALRLGLLAGQLELHRARHRTSGVASPAPIEYKGDIETADV